MKFLDLSKVYVRSGRGGNGAASFRREKSVEYGGPDGGNGGAGGDVIVEAVDGLNTLIDFRYQQHFFAQNGKGGAGRQMTGRDGKGMAAGETLRSNPPPIKRHAMQIRAIRALSGPFGCV